MLKNKNILVTGGSRGIGKAIVEVLLGYGANVGFTFASRKEEAEKLQNKWKKNSQAYQSDASDFHESQILVENFIKDFGSIDAVVNNAGITRDNLLLKMTEGDFDKVIKTNLKSVFNLCKASYMPLIKQRNGSIVNISSVVGVRGNAGQVNYAASKSGIHGITKSLALELAGRNIRVNAIAPGFIETEMTETVNSQRWLPLIPLKRAGKPEEIAQLVAFLISDNATYITGQVIEVNGGLNT